MSGPSDFGELVEKLCIANIKLFGVCDKKADMAANPGKYSKEELAKVMQQDIQLCKLRAKLKSELNTLLSPGAIEEVKNYGA